MKTFKLVSGEWLSVCRLLNAEQNEAAKWGDTEALQNSGGQPSVGVDFLSTRIVP